MIFRLHPQLKVGKTLVWDPGELLSVVLLNQVQGYSKTTEGTKQLANATLFTL